MCVVSDGLRFSVNEETGSPMISLGGPWRSAYARHFASGAYTALELNDQMGFLAEDLEFLAEVPALRELVVISGVASDRGVRHCVGLTHLTLNTSSTDPVDFSGFHQLKYASLGSLRGKESVLLLPWLESLYVQEYRAHDLSPLDRLTLLRNLQLGPARRLTTLDGGLERFTNLTKLAVYHAPRLRDLNALREVPLLVELELYSCRSVADLSAIGDLRRLTSLLLIDCGRVASLKPLQNCPELQVVLFYGSTNVEDGDLSVLDDVRVRKVSFQNRRHYNRRREHLPGTMH